MPLEHPSKWIMFELRGLIFRLSRLKHGKTRGNSPIKPCAKPFPIQCFEGEVHSWKIKCIPFFSTLPPSWLLALQLRGVWRMGNVIFFSIFNLALACLRMHFFFKLPYQKKQLVKARHYSNLLQPIACPPNSNVIYSWDLRNEPPLDMSRQTHDIPFTASLWSRWSVDGY